MEQFGSHWMDFCEILYWGLILKCVDKIQVRLKSDKKYVALYVKTYVCCTSLTDMYVKVKFSLEQAMKAQRGNRGIALLFL
jgi:hypothetical protein